MSLMVAARAPGKHRSGFTLIELVIYFGIFAVMVALGGVVLSYALKSKNSTGRASEVFLGTERALLQIIDEVHSASAVTSASGNTLQLKMVDPASDPAIISLVSGGVTLKEGTNATTTITPSTIIVSSLSFTKINNASSSVQVKITAGYNDNGTVDPNTLYSLQTAAFPL